MKTLSLNPSTTKNKQKKPKKLNSQKINDTIKKWPNELKESFERKFKCLKNT
jgi:hypothetical protein